MFRVFKRKYLILLLFFRKCLKQLSVEGEERQLVKYGEGENLLFEDQESNIEGKQSTTENLNKYLELEDSKNGLNTN